MIPRGERGEDSRFCRDEATGPTNLKKGDEGKGFDIMIQYSI